MTAWLKVIGTGVILVLVGFTGSVVFGFEFTPQTVSNGIAIVALLEAYRAQEKR